MLGLDALKIEDMLGKTLTCSCGKEHTVDIDKIVIEKGAINKLSTVIAPYKAKRILLVADNNTYAVAGSTVESLLEQCGHSFKSFIYSEENQLEANEKTIGRLLFEVEQDTDLILAVGAGTINDLCRFVSCKIDIPYVFVATAPSMDGYASPVAPVVINNLKISPYMGCPKAIIADIDIIKDAPMHMITAGLGDMLGKYTALCDWELARIVKDEYYCSAIVALVKKSICKCVEDLEGVKKREDVAIKRLVEGLVLSGIGMIFAGNSRPAAGVEHLISHFWEMMFLMNGKEAVLHGTKVGVGTVIGAKLAEMLLAAKVDFHKAIEKVAKHDDEKWEAYIQKVYRDAAPEVLALEQQTGNNTVKKHAQRIEKIEKHWDEITKIIEEIVPKAKVIEKTLESLGGVTRPKEIGIDDDMLVDAIIAAKDSRDKYTILHFLWDVGLLEDFACAVKEYFSLKEKSYVKQDLQAVKQRLSHIKCFILDMDGTVYLGGKLLDGAMDFIDVLEEKQKQFYFFTNNSSRNVAFYEKKLKDMGCEAGKGKVLISNQVIIKHLQKKMPGKRVFVLGTPYLVEDLEMAGIKVVDQDPDVVVVGFDTTLDYDRLAKACDYIREEIPVLGVNPDLNCPTETGFIPDCGAICALIHASTGVMPSFYGKPSAHTLNYILEHTGLQAHEIAVVGDRLYTDIAIGKGNDVLTALVLTGETKIKDITHSDVKPDLIFESLKEMGKIIS